jgi:hypothetical protein
MSAKIPAVSPTTAMAISARRTKRSGGMGLLERGAAVDTIPTSTMVSR